MKRIGDPQSEEELQAFLGALYTAVQKSEAFLPAALIALRTAERFFMHCMGDSLALRNGWAMGASKPCRQRSCFVTHAGRMTMFSA